MPSRPAVRYTYQDYLAIPEDTSPRHEIVDGELFVTPTPRVRHQEVVMNVAAILYGFIRSRGLGTVLASPTGVHLHDAAVVQPDVIFIRSDRMAIADPDGDVHGPPDLVVEVLSSSNRDYDRTLKRKLYMDDGVAELWIVDADERTVEVWTPGAEEPRTLRDRLRWGVGDAELEIRLDEVFRS